MSSILTIGIIINFAYKSTVNRSTVVQFAGMAGGSFYCNKVTLCNSPSWNFFIFLICESKWSVIKIGICRIEIDYMICKILLPTFLPLEVQFYKN